MTDKKIKPEWIIFIDEYVVCRNATRSYKNTLKLLDRESEENLVLYLGGFTKDSIIRSIKTSSPVFLTWLQYP